MARTKAIKLVKNKTQSLFKSCIPHNSTTDINIINLVRHVCEPDRLPSTKQKEFKKRMSNNKTNFATDGRPEEHKKREREIA